MEQMGCTLEGMEEERMILGRDAQKILKIARLKRAAVHNRRLAAALAAVLFLPARRSRF